MYGQVAGAGFTAGVPAALAFTGVTSTGFAFTLGCVLLTMGVAITFLRRSYRGR